ncbi:MAG: leucine-rich repeat domain-containing protein, partial [Alistipes sp.]|nr:leucine-rich repeat domain-containing protein [Alistipes sp.]
PKSSQLETLSCSSNQLTKLNISENPNLSSLSCSSNQLEKLDVSKNLNLSFLNCSNNQLVNLNLANNPALWMLYCFSNYLESIDISMTKVGRWRGDELYPLDCAPMETLKTLYFKQRKRLYEKYSRHYFR